MIRIPVGFFLAIMVMVLSAAIACLATAGYLGITDFMKVIAFCWFQGCIAGGIAVLLIRESSE